MDLLEMVKEAGVIGAGGAGFPTHVKLNAEAEYLLLNGAECEPLLRVDQQLMEYFPEDVIRGVLLAKEAVKAKKAVIGIKGKHQDVVRILRETIGRLGLEGQVEVGILPDVYPAGDEQVLVYELTGRIVPETGIPIAVGCVVVNTETAYNIYHASLGEAVTEKFVTVAGDVPNPVTVKVPVGLPVRELLSLAGVPEAAGWGVIDGGPMMGPLLGDLEGFVTKKTKGFVVLSREHSLIRKKSREMRQAIRVNRAACEQCRMCTDLCPRHLLGHSTSPHKLVRAMAYGREGDETLTAALTCCQCNLCEYFSCPAGISPRMANTYYMAQLRQAGIRHTPKEEFQVNPMREYRMVPSKRLVARLGLTEFDQKAPLLERPKITADRFGFALDSHVGAPAVPIVEPGDQIVRGQKLAEARGGALGAAVHASVSGRVEALEPGRIVVRRE